MGVVAAGLIGFFFFVTLRLTEPQLGLLFSNLDTAEAARIMDRLDGMNVPYKMSADGEAILAPKDQISKLRVSLAGEGLGGSVVGYEIFDRGDTLGATSFVQNVNHIRAIEGELARTISEINAVQSARVHIVMPQRQLFSREERRPSASIVLRTGRGSLGASQVNAIKHLVSTAIPGLEPNQISIVDQNGSLLARGGEGEDGGLIMSGLDDKRVGLENRLSRQIEELLEKTVGVGRVRAEVSVLLNRNRVTRNSQVFDPDGQVVVSSNTLEETSRNQEGETEQTITVANNLPDAAGQQTGPTETSSSSNDRTQETVNYEVSRTTTTEIQEAGEVQRLTVAVLVDGTYTTDAEGNSIYAPRSDEELSQYQSLVRSAIGVDEARGDTIEVVNMRFAEIETVEPIVEEAALLGFRKDELTRLIEIVVFGIVSVLILLLIVRPLVNKLIAAIPEPKPVEPRQLADQTVVAGQLPSPEDQYGITAEIAAKAAEGDEEALAAISAARDSTENKALPPMPIDAEIDVARIEGRVQDSALKKVGEIVSRHPDESASIVRQWLYS